MVRPDNTASAALGQQVIRPAFFAWLDIIGDPVRATTWIADITPTGTGDPDLDGHAFDALDPSFVTIGGATNKPGGSETVYAQLSGLVGPDTDLLNLIGDQANWRGRDARLWYLVHDEAYAPQGGICAYYTGRMISVEIKGSPENQIIQVGIESYLATLTQPSNRAYLDQAYYDAGDLSAQVAISIANGDTGGLSDNVRNTGALTGILGVINGSKLL